MHIVYGSQKKFVPASHENPKDPGVLKRVLATHAHLIKGQVMMVNWALLPRGRAFQPHFHEDMQEFFIILNGIVRMTVNGEDYELGEGDAIIIDAKEIHSMKNLSESDIEYIVFGISKQKGGKTVNV